MAKKREETGLVAPGWDKLNQEFWRRRMLATRTRTSPRPALNSTAHRCPETCPHLSGGFFGARDFLGFRSHGKRGVQDIAQSHKRKAAAAIHLVWVHFRGCWIDQRLLLKSTPCLLRSS